MAQDENGNEIPDVNSSEASTEESIENQQEGVESAQNTAEQEAEASDETTHEVESTPEIPTPPGQQEGVDEMGVPWKNRYMESQRKLDKVIEQNNTILEKSNDQGQGQKGEKYSIEELENFEASTENPDHKKWASREIRKLEREEGAKIVETALDKRDAVVKSDQTKQATLHTVMQRYPDAFVKNQAGQTVGWNPKSPLAQRIGYYMQNPDMEKNPQGLLAAAALAFSDISQGQAQQNTATTKKLKGEVKNLQKKTLTEGAGVNSPTVPKTPINAAKEKLRNSGSIKDGAAAFKEILKKKGRITED